MIYLDTSAIVKLIREEPESVALHEVLTADDTPPLFTSQLALTEIKRVLHAAGAAEQAAEATTVSPPAVVVPGHRIVALPVTAELASAAGDVLPGSALRSLDAIHIATALLAGNELTSLITYDQRMGAAATSMALPVAAPSPPLRS